MGIDQERTEGTNVVVGHVAGRNDPCTGEPTQNRKASLVHQNNIRPEVPVCHASAVHLGDCAGER